MKTLRAKHISMHTMAITAVAGILFAIMAKSQEAAVMATGWGTFKTQMTNWFYNGLGKEGTQGIGIVIAVIGIIVAVISFVVHKFNPQSRMPSWFTCLIVAVIGTLLFGGVAPVLNIIQWLRDTVLGWFGFGDLNIGSYS